MMSGDALSDRGRALEEAFFAKQNEALRQRLRDTGDAAAKRQAFAAASGITDDAMLDRLVGLGIGADTLAALSLVPLVLVAWADGSIDAKERGAVLSGAEAAGINKAHPSHALLEGWLARRPPAELSTTWKDYIGAVSATMDGTARDALRRNLLGRARSVAETTGGVLGFGQRVSATEEAVLRDLGAAFAA